MKNPDKKCCGLDRREFLRATASAGLSLGFMGMGLPSMFGLRQALGGVPAEGALYDAALSIFMDGGPSQTDTLDPKPGSPSQGTFGSVLLGCNDVYGQPVRISDALANLASVASNPGSGIKLGLVRSLSHQNDDHAFAQNYMNTWWGSAPAANEYPSMASVMAHYYQGTGIGLPSVVIGPEKTIASSTPNLSRCPAPLMVSPGQGGANPVVEALKRPAGVDQVRYDRRRAFSAALDKRFMASRPDAVARSWKDAADEAHRVTSGGQAAQAFDLTGVPLLPAGDPDTARRLTLARRLLEAGVPYVATGIVGNDSHDNNRAIVQNNWGMGVNQGVTALCQSLQATGKRVLVMIYGDFGRTPDSVNPNGQNRDGRDHWSDGFSVGLISVNQPKFKSTAIGDTGPDGLWQQGGNGLLKDPVAPKDLGAFVYRSLGFQLGRTDGKYDVPMADRDAPPVDRMNKGSQLLSTFGLV